ncbi:MAG: S4 domain-containing protein, partial [Candidatus Roizmanbacteria bacterium]|nr:S4 domain-containing protein [Candidatus Roizmanbacteria bacterium]
RDLKRQLARELVTIYWSKEAAEKAEKEFDRIFIRKDIPEDIEEYFLQTDFESIDIIQLLSETKLATSRSEARRLIEQGGVSIDGNKVSDINQIVSLTESIILKIGKRKFLKVTRKNKQ